MSIKLEQALQGIEKRFRERILASYLQLKRAIAEARHDSVGLSSGKLCEAVIRHLQSRVLRVVTPFGKAIKNFPDECRRIITSDQSSGISDSEKIIIPRALVFLFTMRNKRGIGHLGGDVDPNAIDAALMGRAADWIMCELIRVHHALSLEEAQDIVDGISVRALPDVWEVAGKKRVLREGLDARQKTLLLLYSAADQAVLTEDLILWVEYSNSHVFKSNVLTNLHKERFVEWDRDAETVTLSPKGAKCVEDEILRTR